MNSYSFASRSNSFRVLPIDRKQERCQQRIDTRERERDELHPKLVLGETRP